MVKDTFTFSDWLLAEMRSRKLGVREFANFCGVSHASISRHLDDKNKYLPSVELLIKIAEATGTPLESLMAIAYPSVAVHLRHSAKAMLLADRFDKLPKPIQDFILRAVFGEQTLSDDE